MAHSFSFIVNVTLERSEGLFVSREEMSEAIAETLDVDPGTFYLGDSTYDVTDWSVEEMPIERPKRAKR